MRPGLGLELSRVEVDRKTIPKNADLQRNCARSHRICFQSHVNSLLHGGYNEAYLGNRTAGHGKCLSPANFSLSNIVTRMGKYT